MLISKIVIERCIVDYQEILYILDWKGNDETVCGAKVMNITNMIIVNCTSTIPWMNILTKKTNDTPILEQYSEIQESMKNNRTLLVSDQLNSDGKTVYDEANKNGLIYVESLNKGDSQGISPVHIEVSGIFVIGCHYAVGSGISIMKLLMELTDSVFIEPSCYSNMIYLNRTLGTIDNYIFSSRNSTYYDFNLLNVFEQISEEGKDMCPNNAQYYSSTSYGNTKCNLSTLVVEAENLTINQTSSFNKYESQQGSGGGIYVLISSNDNLTIKGDTILGNQCSFTECKSNGKNGGGIYTEAGDNIVFNLNEILIIQFENQIDSTTQSGYGREIFLVVMNDYNLSNLEIDLSKAYFLDNEAVYGKSLYAVTENLNELCLLNFNLDKGDYLRGDYDDDNSPEIELQGINLTLTAFNSLS
ncbi:MAG: hypothetical protein EZS28_033841 [Streblomastix strix]|uniref:Right handed beta helix domain-containing protein n=1 Tax=Streblomastix strix TaxID=222440 RepID=A0A5J4UKV1_9EUKA|nr:MAG: hypothetical protein EZS28_033841 [Streblomastix strix]